MITNTTLFKVTGSGATACHGGTGQWYKPHSKNRPGKWMPPIKDIYPCYRGYHICQGKDVLEWFGKELYEAEIRGEQIKDDNKIVAEQARLVRRIKTWNKRTARLWACDCVEHVLHVCAEEYPKAINKLVETIRVARAYANGEATAAELEKAQCNANSKLYDYCSIDVYYAVRAAYYISATADSDVDNSIGYAWYAVYPKQRDSERQWQWNRLLKYLNGELD